MVVELLAYTQRNPALTPASVQGLGDLPTLWQGKGTYAENLIEFAGRVCYRSTHRMGTAGDFISDRVREGHEDIIEHVVATVRFTGTDEPLRWRLVNRHCEISAVGPQDVGREREHPGLGGFLPQGDRPGGAAPGEQRGAHRLHRVWRGARGEGSVPPSLTINNSPINN